MRAAALGFAAALLGAAMSVQAQTPPTYSARVTGLTVGTGGQAKATLNMVRGADGVWTQAQYGINAATLGKFAASAVRRLSGAATAYALVKGVVEGAGWAIDELQQQVVDGDPSAPPKQDKWPTADNVYWCMTASQIGMSSSNGSLCTSTSSQMSAFLVGKTMRPNMETINNCFLATASRLECRTSPGSFELSASKTTILPPADTNVTPYKGPQPVSMEDLGQKMMQSAAASTAVMTNPQGVPYDHTELRNAINAALSAFAAQNGNTYTPPQLPPPVEPQPNQPPQPAPGTDPAPNINLEFPVFCEWASVVCDFITWYKEEPTPVDKELPEEEWQPPEETWASGLPSTGTCPAPVSTTISFAGVAAPVQFAYDPLCSLASLMRPVFIAGSLVIAAFIVGGFRSGKHA